MYFSIKPTFLTAGSIIWFSAPYMYNIWVLFYVVNVRKVYVDG